MLEYSPLPPYPMACLYLPPGLKCPRDEQVSLCGPPPLPPLPSPRPPTSPLGCSIRVMSRSACVACGREEMFCMILLTTSWNPLLRLSATICKTGQGQGGRQGGQGQHMSANHLQGCRLGRRVGEGRG